MSSITVAPETINTTGAKTGEPDFGSGRYSGVMREAFKDARRYTDLELPRAEQFARDLGSDLGRANWSVTTSYGKAGKDGLTSLKEVSKAKLTETRAITLARILTAFNDARALALKSGLLDVTSATVKVNLTY